MKENTKYAASFLAALLIIFLFAGCAGQETQGSEETSSTTLIHTADPQGIPSAEKVTTTAVSATTTRKETTTPDTTVPLNKGLNESCAIDADCISRCCAYDGTKHNCADAEACKPPKKATEEECYARQMNWCAGSCQKAACGNCTTYLRCVVSTDVDKKRQVLVERAKDSPERSGSCMYPGETENAAGENGYCGQHKGEMIYAKCGSEPEAKDCAAAYGNPLGYTYRIMNQRAFHAPGGAEYDLWCFVCERAG
jgi:hypothetical protein